MGVLYDEQGRPYSMVGNTGRRSYISPVAMGTGTRPTDGGGIYRTDYKWDTKKGDWTRGIDWGNVLTTGIAGIGAAAALPAVLGTSAGAGTGASTGAAASTGATTAAGTLPSSVIGTGMVPTVAGGTGLGSSSMIGSILSNVMKYGGGISDILGKASGARQGQQNFDTQNALNWEKLRLDAPRDRANTALKAATAKNYTRRKVNWGGPGSGLRGELPTFSGGSAGAAEMAAQDPMVRQMLDDAIAGRVPESYAKGQNQGGGLFDKILGGAALGSSLVGGINKIRGR